MNFRIGQKVVCIKKSRDTPPVGEVQPCVGGIYTVRGIVDWGGEWGVGLYLQEIHNSPINTNAGVVERTFSVRRFRPAVERKTDISIFTKMLNTTKTPQLDICQ